MYTAFYNTFGIQLCTVLTAKPAAPDITLVGHGQHFRQPLNLKCAKNKIPLTLKLTT